MADVRLASRPSASLVTNRACDDEGALARAEQETARQIKSSSHRSFTGVGFLGEAE